MLFPYKEISPYPRWCQDYSLKQDKHFVTLDTDQIRAVYEEAFRWYDATREMPVFHVSFYPYIGINHTVRIRNGEIYVRVGDGCRDMPYAPPQGLAYILLGKLLRRKIPDGANDVYNAYTRTAEMREKAADNKRARGRKVMTTTKGVVYDLDEIFDAMNWQYFRGFLPKPSLTWSSTKTYRILGHHDATHNHITISKSLDSLEVPRFVVEYVLYHEMLHVFHPTEHDHNGRRYNHTSKFRADEEKFEHYQRAEDWIERNVRKLKRAAKASRR